MEQLERISIIGLARRIQESRHGYLQKSDKAGYGNPYITDKYHIAVVLKNRQRKLGQYELM